MNNEIILRSVYGKVNQTYFIQPCPDPRTGRLPECVKSVDSHGDMILSEEEVRAMGRGEKFFVAADSVFEIVDGTKFDLDDVVDRAKWESIENCNWIAKDRFQRDAEGNLVIDGNAKKYGVADIYVERPGELTKAKVSKKQLVFRAYQYINDDSESGRIKKCKVLGRNLSNAIPADILDYLFEIGEKNPKKIIDLYEGEDWKMQLFIMDAIDRGVIRNSEGLYKYNDKVLGGSMEAAVILLRDIRFKAILKSIQRETYPELLPKSEVQSIMDETNRDINFLSGEEDTDTETSVEPVKKTPSKKQIK